MNRDVIIAVKDCPLNNFIPLDDCKKCPYFKSFSLWKNVVDCDYLSPSEKRMKEEPVLVVEPKSRW